MAVILSCLLVAEVVTEVSSSASGTEQVRLSSIREESHPAKAMTNVISDRSPQSVQLS
jgi:hypothetical protein